MNQIQKELLSISKVFIDICSKHNLTYFAVAGTCLGAVRHGGFIPWDDDADFAMPRDDYIFLLNNQENILPSGYFFQTWESENQYTLLFGKIRNSSTTAIEENLKDLSINHGLWIDIFPIDGMPLRNSFFGKMRFVFFKTIRMRYLLVFDKSCNKEGLKKLFVHKYTPILLKLIIPFKCVARLLYKKMLKKYNFYNYGYCYCNDVNVNLEPIPKDFFGKGKKVDFEDIALVIPERYDDYLKFMYGDWKQLPPLNEREGNHPFYLLDLKKSYKFYLK